MSESPAKTSQRTAPRHRRILTSVFVLVLIFGFFSWQELVAPKTDEAKFARLKKVDRRIGWANSSRLSWAVSWIDRFRDRPLDAALWSECFSLTDDLKLSGYLVEVRVPSLTVKHLGQSAGNRLSLEAARSGKFAMITVNPDDISVLCRKDDAMHWRQFSEVLAKEAAEADAVLAPTSTITNAGQ